MKATTLTKITLISICAAIGLIQVPMAQAQFSPTPTSQTSQTFPSQTSDIPPSYPSYPSYPGSGISLDVSSVINGILSPPHRQAEITANANVEMEKLRQNARIEKAKITAEAGKTVDRVAPILTQWGVNRVNCAPGVAFINGLSTGTVCLNPTASIPVGYYNYSPDRQQLVRIQTNNPPTPAATVANVGTNIAPTPVPASTVVKNANGANTARDRGF
jgi:hypothetical protein